MFLAIVFIILGLFLLLNAFGIIISANFWGFFWAIVFLALGIKMLMKKGKCPMCSGMWFGEKIHGKMYGECCGHDHDQTGHDQE